VACNFSDARAYAQLVLQYLVRMKSGWMIRKVTNHSSIFWAAFTFIDLFFTSMYSFDC
jgi:hypothetical protein